jgi:hypothetical protein
MSKLIQCATCKATIAANAAVCPNCGVNHNKLPGGALSFIVILGLFLFFLMMPHGG